MQVGDRELTAEEERRVRDQALACWRQTVEPLPRGPAAVICELYEHASQPCVVVTDTRGGVLAWFRVGSQGERLRLQPVTLEEVPASIWLLDPADVLASSAGLRAHSNWLAARSSALRARSAALRPRSTRLQALHSWGRRTDRRPAGQPSDPRPAGLGG